MSGGGDFVQRGEKNIAKIEINVLNLKFFEGASKSLTAFFTVYQNFISLSCISFPEGNPIQNTEVNFCVLTLIRNCMYRRRIFYALYIALLISKLFCARIYGPSFRENKPKTLVFFYWKRAFWACFRQNWVYKFGHCTVKRWTGLDWTGGGGGVSGTKEIHFVPLLLLSLGQSITRAIGRGGPWKSRFYWALKWQQVKLMYIKGFPKKMTKYLTLVYL